MKYLITRNVGANLLKKLQCDRTDLLEGATVDLDAHLAEELTKRGLATRELHGVAQQASVLGVPADDSPVDNLTAQDAIDGIGRMTSKEKLQHIADNDKRTTVSEAAKKRLASL